MINIEHITDGTTQKAMHKIIDSAYCAVLVYAKDDGGYGMTAVAKPQCEDSILDCIAVASARMSAMICDNLDEPEL